MRLLRFRCFHLRFFRAGLSIIRFFRLFFRLPDGLFVKVVFGIIHASVRAAHTFAHQIAALFQLFKRRSDAFHPFFTDGGQPANREIPILRQCQNHCQQSLCLERQPLIPQMIIADGRVILDFLYAKYAHIENLRSVCKFKKRVSSDKRRFCQAMFIAHSEMLRRPVRLDRRFLQAQARQTC